VKFYKECVPGDYTKTGPSDAGHRAFGTEKRAFVDELTHNQRGRGVTSPDLEGNVGDAHQGSSE
jgi:hypothetical protein